MGKFNCILYGDSGAGKTPFSGTLAQYEETSPCLFLDIDMGTMSLDGVEPRALVVPVEDFVEIERIYKTLHAKEWDKLATGLSNRLGYEVPSVVYKSVVLDSGTELEYMLRRAIVERDDRQEGIPDQPHYLKTQERFRTLYRKFRNLPDISVVTTAGVRELKEESTGIVRRFPDFQPSLCHDLVRMTDLIFYMDATAEGTGSDAKWEHRLTSSLSKRFVARDRSQKLKPQMTAEKFYWKDICEKIFN